MDVLLGELAEVKGLEEGVEEGGGVKEGVLDAAALVVDVERSVAQSIAAAL